MLGYVRRFDSQKGYGFLTGQDGTDCFVHFSNIQMDGFKTLEKGQTVEFTVGRTTDGRTTARNVRVISAEEIEKEEGANSGTNQTE